MTEIQLHPLTQIIELYCSEYSTLREDNLDLQPMGFQKNYGLTVEVPYSWDVLSSVKYIVDNRSDKFSKIAVIFGITASYRKIYDVLQDKVEYFSWHEINTGIHAASTDIRYIHKVKRLLSESDLTFFLDPPSMPEILDQVCGQALNCLIVLSGGGI